MSDPKLMTYLEKMKTQFWHEHQHLQQDDIMLEWKAKTASYANLLLGTEAPTTQSLELPSAQGHQMARQSSSKSWAETPLRRRASVRTQLRLPTSLIHGADASIEYRCSSRIRPMLLYYSFVRGDV